MRKLDAMARRLRLVKNARRQFLMLWALESLGKGRASAEETEPADERRRIEAAIADPWDHDWTLLYRGSILDD